MIKACEVKRGDIVRISSAPHVAESIQVQTPSARGRETLYKIRFRNIHTKQKVDQVLRGDDIFQEADFERQEVQYLFHDPSGHTFMNLSDFSQFTLSDEELAGEAPYLTDGMEGIKALVSDGQVIGIELPPVVELQIARTDPSLRGASVTGRNKPATLSTGLVVQVPEYMSSGEIIRVDTRTGTFISRA